MRSKVVTNNGQTSLEHGLFFAPGQLQMAPIKFNSSSTTSLLLDIPLLNIVCPLDSGERVVWSLLLFLVFFKRRKVDWIFIFCVRGGREKTRNNERATRAGRRDRCSTARSASLLRFICQTGRGHGTER